MQIVLIIQMNKNSNNKKKKREQTAYWPEKHTLLDTFL